MIRSAARDDVPVCDGTWRGAVASHPAVSDPGGSSDITSVAAPGAPEEP